MTSRRRCRSVSVGADFFRGRVPMNEYLRRAGAMELPGLAPSTSAAGSILLRWASGERMLTDVPPEHWGRRMGPAIANIV